MPNPWGYKDLPTPKTGGSSVNGPGRQARQTEGERVSPNSHLVLPIDFVGPDIDVINALLQDNADYTHLAGGKAEPAPLFPPEVPMSEDQLKSLSDYLERELALCEGERLPVIRKLARLKYKYRTEFPDVPKNWPIANSSQITIPVIKTSVDTINGRLYQTTLAADPMIRVKTEDELFSDFAFDYEEFLKMYDTQVLDLEELLEPWITELVILGTAVLETTNWRDQKSVAKFDPSTGKFYKETITCHSGPMVFHFPIEDFWIRPTQQDPQKAPWCGKELRLSWSDVKQMAFSGELNPDHINRISRFTNLGNEVPVTVRADQRVERWEPNQQSMYTIYELCVRWDVDGDGLEEEIIVYYHRPSRTILRRKFNNFYKGRRPWTVGRYKRIPHRFYGEGIAETLEHLQEEISTIHNQRIDNATIANLRIILVAKLLQGLKPGDRLWSGKIVKVTDIQKDVGTLQLGEVYPSTVENESIAQGYVREVSGASETATGQSQPVSRTTAYAQQALLEELNRRFDKPLRNIRRCIKDVHDQLSDLFLEQGTGGLAEQWLGALRGRRVEAFLQLPPEQVNKKMKLTISSVKSSNNREADLQTQIAVMQLIVQNGQQLLTLIGQLAPQALGLVAHELIKTIRPVFRKIMAYAESGDPDEAAAILDVVERILPAPEDMGGMDAASREQQIAALVAGRGGGTTSPNGRPQAPVRPTGGIRMASPPTLPGQGNGGQSVSAGPGGGY